MRILLRLLAPLLGLAIAAAGAIAIIEVVAAWVRPGSTGVVVPWSAWQSSLTELTWSDNPVPVIGIVVGVIGLLLLVLVALARRHDVPLNSPSEEMTVSTSPRVLARLVGRHVRATDEVAGATVSASARKVAVTAEGYTRPDPTDGGDLRTTVRERVDGLLDELPLTYRPRVAVTTRTRKELR
ncbi:MAG: DUF6286 domain-containing protein [Pseudonocardia sp.]|nr:DUF6286 domain-containing protein [Pseudonocardia sp.]